jgi:hypothetical protein
MKNVYLDELLETCSFKQCVIIGSRESSVDIATKVRAGRPGFDFLQRQEIFLFSIESRPAMGPIRPAIQWKPVALSPEAHRQGREPDDSPPSSAEVKYVGAITPLPHTSSRRGA